MTNSEWATQSIQSLAHERMVRGQLKYGKYNPKTDIRIMPEEIEFELADALNYMYMDSYTHPLKEVLLQLLLSASAINRRIYEDTKSARLAAKPAITD